MSDETIMVDLDKFDESAYKARYKSSWSNETRNEILSEIEGYLFTYLYAYSDSVSEIELAISKLTRLTPAELLLLKKIHFLESNETKTFIEVSKKLVKNLSHSTENPVEINRGMVKGSIDWKKTLEERSKEGFKNKSIFACRTTNKIYDLPENQLFKFLLNRVADFTRSNVIGDEPSLKLKESEVEKWQDSIIKSRRTALKIRNKSHVRDVTDISYVKPKFVRRAYSNKNDQYKAVVDCYKLYRDLFLDDDSSLETLHKLILEYVLKPLNDNRLFEIYVLFRLVETLPNDENLTMWLIRPENKYEVCEYSFDNKIIKIYYQNNPFASFSKKAKLSKSYNDFNVDAGIPDLIIEIIEGDDKKYRLVEIKNSSDPDYIRTGLIETFAYLKEYEDLNIASSMGGVLVSFGGIGEVNQNSFDNEIAIFDKDSFDSLNTRRRILFD